jgi:hypothetical protein
MIVSTILLNSRIVIPDLERPLGEYVYYDVWWSGNSKMAELKAFVIGTKPKQFYIKTLLQWEPLMTSLIHSSN